MSQDRPPLILDFDGAVSDIPGALTLPLQAWQEKIRFGCRWAQFRELETALHAQMPGDYGCVFTGSGDYHHLSQLLLNRLPSQQTQSKKSMRFHNTYGPTDGQLG